MVVAVTYFPNQPKLFLNYYRISVTIQSMSELELSPLPQTTRAFNIPGAGTFSMSMQIISA